MSTNLFLTHNIYYESSKYRPQYGQNRSQYGQNMVKIWSKYGQNMVKIGQNIGQNMGTNHGVWP